MRVVRRCRRDGARRGRRRRRGAIRARDRDARRGERHARHRQLAARVPRRARARCPTSTGTASPRSTWTSTSGLAADASGELPALHARAGRRAASRSRSSTTSTATRPTPRPRPRATPALLARASARPVLRGIGENGHLAFNDPPVADFDDPLDVKIVALDDGVAPPTGRRRSLRRRSTTCRRTRSPSRSPRCSRAEPRARDRARGAQGASRCATRLHGPISTACPASILRRQANAIALPRPGVVGAPRLVSAPPTPDGRRAYAQVLSFPSARELRAPACRRSSSGLFVLGLRDLGVGARRARGLALGRVPPGRRGGHRHRRSALVVVLVGLVVLLAWIPLRQRLGVGTVLNTLSVGLIANLGLYLIPEQHALVVRVPMLLGSIVMFGRRRRPLHRLRSRPGTARRADDRDHCPRPSALGRAHRRWSARALVVGFLLGGHVGVGTVLLAFAIGPVTHAGAAPVPPAGRATTRRRCWGSEGRRHRHAASARGSSRPCSPRPTVARWSTSCRRATTTRSRARVAPRRRRSRQRALAAVPARAARAARARRRARPCCATSRSRSTPTRRPSSKPRRAPRVWSRSATSSSASHPVRVLLREHGRATARSAASSTCRWTHLSAGIRVPLRPWGWLFDRALGGGWIGAWGSHAVDTLRWMFGPRCADVQALLRIDVAERARRRRRAAPLHRRGRVQRVAGAGERRVGRDRQRLRGGRRTGAPRSRCSVPRRWPRSSARPASSSAAPTGPARSIDLSAGRRRCRRVTSTPMRRFAEVVRDAVTSRRGAARRRRRSPTATRVRDAASVDRACQQARSAASSGSRFGGMPSDLDVEDDERCPPRRC